MLSRASKKWERGPWGWCLLAFHQCPEPILQTVIQGQPVSVLQSPWLFLPSICLFCANGTGSISILFASWQSLTLSAQALRTPESLWQTSKGPHKDGPLERYNSVPFQGRHPKESSTEGRDVLCSFCLPASGQRWPSTTQLASLHPTGPSHIQAQETLGGASECVCVCSVLGCYLIVGCPLELVFFVPPSQVLPSLMFQYSLLHSTPLPRFMVWLLSSDGVNGCSCLVTSGPQWSLG